MMNIRQKTSQLVLMVLTRQIEGVDSVGRVNTLRGISTAVSEHFDKEVFHLRSLLEVRKFSRLALRGIGVMLKPNPGSSIQCALFDDSEQIKRLIEKIRATRPVAVYFDSVRCASAIHAVRGQFPGLRLVCDFDDLMSRRCSLVLPLQRGFSFGYLSRFVPGWVRRLVGNPRVARAMLRKEERLLRCAEARICGAVDAVTLVSAVDAATLRSRLGASNCCEIHVVPPLFVPRKQVDMPELPVRFVFLGPDRLLQNLLTIEFLLKMWEEGKYESTLHIYGTQSGTYPSVKNVVFEGFAKDLTDIFRPDSILLSPSQLGGGLKTKILDALAHGVVPLGNDTSFEGMELAENPLALSPQQLQDAPRADRKRIQVWADAARDLQQYMAQKAGGEAQRRRWRAILTGEDMELPVFEEHSASGSLHN
jgi:glycosyltransferase involved in cell wall biosynthesis